MRNVFHDVELRIVRHRLPDRVDGDHGVLGPTPGATTTEWEYHVPIDVSIHTVAQKVMQLGEHIVSVIPGIAPITALAFGLKELKLTPTPMCPLYHPFARPLIPYPRYKGPGTWIEQYRVRPGVIVRSFNRPGQISQATPAFNAN